MSTNLGPETPDGFAELVFGDRTVLVTGAIAERLLTMYALGTGGELLSLFAPDPEAGS